MSDERVDIQIIANLVVRNGHGQVLFVRYDPDNEKWWLPGSDVEPYAHPDDTANQVLRQFEDLEINACRLGFVDSFRGRRGWHLVFNYDARAEGKPGGPDEAQWFAPDEMPRTVHGGWEKEVVSRVLQVQP